jgi:hypothetical protein
MLGIEWRALRRGEAAAAAVMHGFVKAFGSVGATTSYPSPCVLRSILRFKLEGIMLIEKGGAWDRGEAGALLYHFPREQKK